MPINPNIALGVRPMEQPNMLAQMGQMMAIRQAQQDYESQNALRDFYAQGGDLSTAEGKRQLMSRAPVAGMKLIGQQSEISARDIGTAEKSLAMLKDQAGLVKTPQDAANWLTSFYKNPLTRPYVEAVAPMDQALAAIPTDPAALQGWVRNASLKAKDIFESADAQLRAKVDREGHGVQMRGQNIVANTAANRLDFDKARRTLVPTDTGFAVADPYANLEQLKGFGTFNGPNAAPRALPSAAANAFVTAKPPVNGLITQPNAAVPPVVQPGLPTRANAAAIEAQQNVPRPPARAGYKYDQATGNLVKIPDEKPVWNDKAQVWMTPPTAENPQGTVTEAPAVQKAVQERTANATLKVAGYNPKTQTDEVSSLIKQSTSGLAENWGNKVWSAISGTGSKGAEAIAKLETRANEMTLALAPNGSLGAGFSNEDRTFMLGKLGDVANPDKPMNVRLAAWEDVMERTARTAGVPYTKQSFGSSSAPASSGSGGGAKTITRTGTLNGRKVVQYSDGTTAYAD